jgi:hypothetical protein
MPGTKELHALENMDEARPGESRRSTQRRGARSAAAAVRPHCQSGPLGGNRDFRVNTEQSHRSSAPARQSQSDDYGPDYGPGQPEPGAGPAGARGRASRSRGPPERPAVAGCGNLRS